MAYKAFDILLIVLTVPLRAHPRACPPSIFSNSLTNAALFEEKRGQPRPGAGNYNLGIAYSKKAFV